MKKNYSLVFIPLLIAFTGAIALSIHVLLIQYFERPAIINVNPVFTQIAGFVMKFGTVVGAMLIFRLSKKYWIKISPFFRIILFAILLMTLTEQLIRSPIMDIAIGIPLENTLLKAIPSYARFLTLSVLICFFMNVISKNNKFVILKYVIFSASATLGVFFVKDITNHFLSVFFVLDPHINMTKISHPPYGKNIIIPAYITFLEPATATFFLISLVKDALAKFNTFRKGLIIGGILVITHAGFFSILEIACSEGNLLYRIFYYGQFVWEYIVLGILTAYSYTLTCAFEKSGRERTQQTIPL